MTSHRRYTRSNPCPICEGYDEMPRGKGLRCHGYPSTDGDYAHCARPEHANGLELERGNTYAHRMVGQCRCGREHSPAKPKPDRGPAPKKTMERSYRYTDADGRLLFEVVRFRTENPKTGEIGKDFRQRRPKPEVSGGWVWSLGNTPRVLYRLHEITRAPAEAFVFLVEGEKDADALAALGLVATTSPMGATNWRFVDPTPLTGRHVVILPDNDEAGRQYANDARRTLQSMAASVVVIDLPGLPLKGDVSDWLAAGGDPAKLLEITEAAAPKSQPDAPDPWALTDQGNAERFAREHGRNVRYTLTLGWLVWDGKRWKRDDTGEVWRLAKATVHKLLADSMALGEVNRKAAKRAISWALDSHSAAKLGALVKLASSEPQIAVRAEDFDADPWLFNCDNGTIDLRTGKLRPHRREDHITKLSPVAYNPAAECPRWSLYLVEVQPDQSVREYLQRLAGYSLTGVIREHALPMHYGMGRNGKGVFTNTLLYIWGDYGKQIPTEVLMATKGDRHPTERATLFGCRLAAAVETEEGRSLNVALVKQLTGGDPISARYVNKDFFEFLPTHKLMVSTNHRPRIRETKDAIWNRVHLVPWTQQFPDNDPRQDPELGEKIKAEASGILAWAVEGCRMWQRDRLSPPAVVRAATNDYRNDSDTLGAFLDEVCLTRDDFWVSTAALYDAFRKWAESSGEFVVSKKELGSRLTDRGFTPDRRFAGRGWKGLALAPKHGATDEPPPPSEPPPGYRRPYHDREA